MTTERCIYRWRV